MPKYTNLTNEEQLFHGVVRLGAKESKEVLAQLDDDAGVVERTAEEPYWCPVIYDQVLSGAGTTIIDIPTNIAGVATDDNVMGINFDCTAGTAEISFHNIATYAVPFSVVAGEKRSYGAKISYVKKIKVVRAAGGDSIRVWITR